MSTGDPISVIFVDRPAEACGNFFELPLIVTKPRKDFSDTLAVLFVCKMRTVGTTSKHRALVGLFFDAQATITVNTLPIACEPRGVEGVRFAIEIERDPLMDIIVTDFAALPGHRLIHSVHRNEDERDPSCSLCRIR
jgi:hypothetical protein